MLHRAEYPEYDYRFGKLKKGIDENGNITAYDYDPLGRTILVEKKDDQETLIIRHVETEYHNAVLDENNSIVVPKHTVSKVQEDDQGSIIDGYIYFDGSGRKIQTTSLGTGCHDDQPGKAVYKEILTRTYYDEMGREYLRVGPFFRDIGTGFYNMPADDLRNNIECPWVKTAYDKRSRPVEVKSPADSTLTNSSANEVITTFDYDGLSRKATDPDGAWKTEIKDYLGRIIEVIEYEDIKNEEYHTYYEYNAAGDLIWIQDQLNNISSIAHDTLGRKISITDPDMGCRSYAYDANGNIKRQTDAKNETITYDYDELNRVTSKRYSHSGSRRNVSYSYDNVSVDNNGIGKPYQIITSDVALTYDSYDETGNLTRETKSIAGSLHSSYVTEYSYDIAGRLESITYPGHEKVNYSYYPGSMLLEKVLEGSGMGISVTYSEYSPSGKVVQMDYGNHTSTRYTYDPLSERLIGFHTSDFSENPAEPKDLQIRGYGYTSAGDIRNITDELTGTTYCYEYDSLHRLTKEYTTGTAPRATGRQNSILRFNYDPEQFPLHAPTSVSLNGAAAIPYSYDNNGNQTSGYDLSDSANVSNREVRFNADNMPIEIIHRKSGNTALLYDGKNVRARKSSKGADTFYINKYLETRDGQFINYVFANNQRVAKVTAITHKPEPSELPIRSKPLHSAKRFYYHKDHLGSTTIMTEMTDNRSNVVAQTEYMPYGLDRNLSADISEINYKFTDQEQDKGTGLYNYKARLYDPVIALFISADNVDQDWYDPQSLNRYAYCSNNPLKYIDPTGHYRSSGWQRAVIPGQVSYDYGRTAAENKQYFRAALHFASMAGEQAMFVLSAGTIQAELKVAQTTGQALRVLAKEAAEETTGVSLPTKASKGAQEITKASKKRFKQTINNLSKPKNTGLSQQKLDQLRRITDKADAKVRVDLEGVKGIGVRPHAHVEGMGKKVESRHIWLQEGVK